MYIELQRKLSPSEKLGRTFQYSTFISRLAESVLRQQWPNAGEREIFLRSARRRLGKELFHKVYGDELADDRPASGSTQST